MVGYHRQLSSPFALKRVKGNCDEHINHHVGSRVCGEIVFFVCVCACLNLFEVVVGGTRWRYEFRGVSINLFQSQSNLHATVPDLVYTFCDMSLEFCLQFWGVNIDVF